MNLLFVYIHLPNNPKRIPIIRGLALLFLIQFIIKTSATSFDGPVGLICSISLHTETVQKTPNTSF